MDSKKIRKIANIVIAVITFIAIVILFKIGDYNSIELGIASSFLVTSFFYFVMEYIPNKISFREKNESMRKRRIIAYKETKEYYTRVIDIWHRIMTAAGYSCPKDDLRLILSEKSVQFVESFNLLSIAKDRPILLQGKLIDCTWKDVICNELEKAEKKGEVLLDRYADLIETDALYAIYSLQSHDMMGNLPKLIRMFDSSNTAGSFILGQCVAIHDSKYVEASDFISYMCIISKWLEQEKSNLKIEDEEVQLWK